MTRLIALFAALLVSTLAVSSACIASTDDTYGFTLRPARVVDQVQVGIAATGNRTTRWSDTMPVGALAGLDQTRFRASGNAPLRFAIVREAGRLDCAGKGGAGWATGHCRFTADAGFTAFLQSRGIGRPNAREGFSLMAVDARRDLVTALTDARFPKPTIDNLVPLAALDVDRRYIASLAAIGYRPSSLDTLVQYKALGISSDFIQSFRQLGYDRLGADDIIQLKALEIDGNFIAGFRRVGYDRLAVNDLVQLRALGVTPHYVMMLRNRGYRDLPVSKLVQMKALGLGPDDLSRAKRAR